MSALNHPSLISTGRGVVISPDGSDRIPADLWGEFAALVLLEPEPPIYTEWVRKLEAKLGVTAEHRRTWARAALMPFPGEAPAKSGHTLTVLDETDERTKAERRRLSGLRPVDETLAWYLFRCATRQEGRAEQRLAEMGFAVYLPRMKRWDRLAMSRRRYLKEQSLFPGYLFVGLFPNQAIKEVEEVEYVHGVVRFGAERFPTPLQFRPPPRAVAPEGSIFAGLEHLEEPPPLTIASTLEAELAGVFDKTKRDGKRDPLRGAPVDIIAGQFRGWPATFVGRRDDERVDLMISMFGKQHPMVVDPEEVDGLVGTASGPP